MSFLKRIDAESDAGKMRLKGKTAIVTGAARGIGKATALRFAQEGAKVVIDDLNAERGEAAAAEARQDGGEAAFFQADVTSGEQVSALFDFALERYGQLDILVNNAVCGTEQVLAHEWEIQSEVILRGVYRCSMAAVEAMRDRGGSIVNIASVNGIFGLQGLHIYSAMKGGVVAFTRSLAVEQGKHGIRVNAICPGTVQTEIWKPMLERNPAIWDEIVRFYPIGRLGEPNDIANCALFLASDESSFATGAAFVIDGGLTAGNAEFPV